MCGAGASLECSRCSTNIIHVLLQRLAAKTTESFGVAVRSGLYHIANLNPETSGIKWDCQGKAQIGWGSSCNLGLPGLALFSQGYSCHLFPQSCTESRHILRNMPMYSWSCNCSLPLRETGYYLSWDVLTLWGRILGVILPISNSFFFCTHCLHFEPCVSTTL